MSRILLFSFLLLSACSSFDPLSEDATKLVRGQGSELSRVLSVEVQGATEKARVIEAFRRELEDGDLFHSVRAADSKSSKKGLLKVHVLRRQSQDFGTWIHDKEGWIVRFDTEMSLDDAQGKSVLQGPVTGISFDDATDKDFINSKKVEEIIDAGLTNAASKLSLALREIVGEQLAKEQEGIQKLELGAGVGPLKLAVLNVDVKRAHPATRRANLATAVESAFELAGPEIEIVSRSVVQRALERSESEDITGLTLSEKNAKGVERYLNARLAVLVTVRSSAQGATIEGHLMEIDGGARSLGRAKASAKGLGAPRIAIARMVRELVGVIARTKFKPRESAEQE